MVSQRVPGEAAVSSGRCCRRLHTHTQRAGSAVSATPARTYDDDEEVRRVAVRLCTRYGYACSTLVRCAVNGLFWEPWKNVSRDCTYRCV